MKFSGFSSAIALLALTFVLSGCSDNGGATPTANQPASPTGTIRGRVQLKGDAPKASSDQITQDQKTCGSSVSLPRIALGKDNAVQNTFVILEDPPKSEALRPGTQSILIDQKDCQYTPHARIVPLGSKVEITNSDPILHHVHGTQEGSGVFNYAQAKQGLRETVDMTMTKPGIISLTCEAGHPWMNAFLYVTTHKFVGQTDDNGEFLIKDIPPGTYTLKMWHEGVALKQINNGLQTYEYEEPYELTRQVTVIANAEALVRFDLTLRK